LNTGLPPYGGQYAFSFFPPGEQPYESLQQNSSQTGITSSGWVPILPQQRRVVYSMQPTQLVSNIPTTLATLPGMTQAQMGIITPHLGQSSSVGQHQMVQQPWLVQYQQP